MKYSLCLFMVIALILGGCQKEESSLLSENEYLALAARHCNCPVSQLNWLNEIITTRRHTQPGATLPATIYSVTLTNHQGRPAFILDSHLNSCSTCPWEVLACEGSSLNRNDTVVRGRVLWKDPRW